MLYGSQLREVSGESEGEVLLERKGRRAVCVGEICWRRRLKILNQPFGLIALREVHQENRTDRHEHCAFRAPGQANLPG